MGKDQHSKIVGGFTLIELLIVVAIIAILAAIAVPNFLEAQTRSKVSRTISDMRTISIAVQTYMVDYNNIPIPPNLPRNRFLTGGFFAEFAIVIPGDYQYPGVVLTTPVSYLTSIPIDLFNTTFFEKISYWGKISKYRQVSAVMTLRDRKIGWVPSSGFNSRVPKIASFYLESAGPDLRWWQLPGENENTRYYDPTNGTISSGQILHYEGGVTFPST